MSRDESTRLIETVNGPKPYMALVPELALGVERAAKRLAGENPEDLRFSFGFILELHREAFGQVVAWAGKPRKADVVVGLHLPPPFYQVPMLLKNFADNVEYRASHIDRENMDLEELSELFADAEGGFTTIHPFEDFNGRISRLLSWALLLRFRLPETMELVAPDGDEDMRKELLDALHAYDQHNHKPLTAIWNRRITQAILPFTIEGDQA